jgi:hypothetical protein
MYLETLSSMANLEDDSNKIQVLQQDYWEKM